MIAPQGGTCNVTETSAGAARSASYACSDNHTTGSAFCQASNQDVIYVTGPGQAATVTVTNTFAAASPIVIVPSFAGWNNAACGSRSAWLAVASEEFAVDLAANVRRTHRGSCDGSSVSLRSW